MSLIKVRIKIIITKYTKKKKKMTQGWVVYGGMRHAEPQREMFPRSYGTMYLNARANGLTNDCLNMRAFLCHLPNPGLICINTFILSRTKPPVLGHNSIQVCSSATCAMLAWTFCCAGLSLIPRFSRTSTFLIGTVALTPANCDYVYCWVNVPALLY